MAVMGEKETDDHVFINLNPYLSGSCMFRLLNSKIRQTKGTNVLLLFHNS